MPNDPRTETTLTIKLVQPAPGAEFEVEHLELQSNDMRHRVTSSKRETDLRSVFCKSFAAFLRGLLGSISGAPGVRVHCDAEYVQGDLVLAHVHVLASHTATGLNQVRVRFMCVTGKVQEILRDAYSRTRSEPSQIAVDALERVVGRSYDAARVRNCVPGFAEAPVPFFGQKDSITEQKDELLFRLQLLQRSVERGVRRHDALERNELNLFPEALGT